MGRSGTDPRKAALIGALAGGIAGYLYRPSAFLAGQLPFQHVLTRGRSLKGLDQLLVPVAERSFDYLLGGILLGAAAGYAIARFAVGRRR